MPNGKDHSERQVKNETQRQGRSGADAGQNYAGLLAALDVLETEFRVILNPAATPG